MDALIRELAESLLAPTPRIDDGLSATLRYKRRLLEAGLCQACRKPRKHYAALCDQCAVRARLRQRKRQQCKPWKPNSRGPKPRVSDRG